jgi:hypothetical protein
VVCRRRVASTAAAASNNVHTQLARGLASHRATAHVARLPGRYELLALAGPVVPEHRQFLPFLVTRQFWHF